MQIEDWQKEVDNWIQKFGVRYFDIKTNMILLTEEVGELARLIARIYGEQSFKTPISPDDQKEHIAEELGDIIFVLTCIANQTGMDLSAVLETNLAKKSQRDSRRHLDNPKLTNENT